MSNEMPGSETQPNTPEPKPEDIMDKGEKTMSEVREKEIEKIKLESELGEEKFQELLNSLQFEEENNGRFKFRIRGHEISGILAKKYLGGLLFRSGGEVSADRDWFQNIIIDGKEITDNNQIQLIIKKFGFAISEIYKLSNEALASRAEEKLDEKILDDILR